MPDTSSGDAGARSRTGRVLLVTSSFPRWPGDASGTFVLNHARDLQACGWTVDVLAPHAPGAKTREEMDAIHVERFRYLWPSALETLCYGGGVLGNLRRNPLNLLKVPLLILGEWAAVLRRLATRRYDVVNSHWLVPQGLVTALAAPLFRVPHVATIHGSDVLALTGRLATAANRFTLRRADAVTVNSAATRAAAEAIAPNLEHVHTIPMGVATDVDPDESAVARIRARYRRPKGPLLVFAGRVVREKGVGDLLDAVARLVPMHADVSAMVVGGGAERDEFQRRAADLGIADRVAFVGPMPPERTLEYMAAADVLVGPSWTEAFGLVFAEALSVGTPVVGTDVGGIAECIDHQRTGLLVPPRAPDAIAAAIDRFVTEPDFAARTAQAGQAMVRRQLNRTGLARAFSDVLHGVRHPRQGHAPGRVDAAAGQRR
jgi:phosphatidylinositol alpha-1,6-mannosyltransferase